MLCVMPRFILFSLGYLVLLVSCEIDCFWSRLGCSLANCIYSFMLRNFLTGFITLMWWLSHDGASTPVLSLGRASLSLSFLSSSKRAVPVGLLAEL